MSRERFVDFDKRNTFPGNYKPIKVKLYLIYKITENNCRSLLLTDSIQIQERCFATK